MPAKKIFVLDGHPAPASLSRSFALTYAEAATAAGHEARVIHLSDLAFDIDFGRAGYADPKPLETDLEAVMDAIRWADHVVIAAPMWWGGLPAKLKGLIDRAFLPGTAFDPRVPAGRLPKPMLAGRSARVILTSDTPGWFLRLVYRNAIVHRTRGQILHFVGLKPARFTHFSGAGHPKAGQVARWTAEVRKLGARAA